MATWQLQNAKTRLSELIEDANTQGPQIITRHGTERAVVISIAEYRELAANHAPDQPKRDLITTLLGGPKLEEDDPFFEALIRYPDPERDTGL